LGQQYYSLRREAHRLALELKRGAHRLALELKHSPHA